MKNTNVLLVLEQEDLITPKTFSGKGKSSKFNFVEMKSLCVLKGVFVKVQKQVAAERRYLSRL